MPDGKGPKSPDSHTRHGEERVVSVLGAAEIASRSHRHTLVHLYRLPSWSILPLLFWDSPSVPGQRVVFCA